MENQNTFSSLPLTCLKYTSSSELLNEKGYMNALLTQPQYDIATILTKLIGILCMLGACHLIRPMPFHLHCGSCNHDVTMI